MCVLRPSSYPLQTPSKSTAGLSLAHAGGEGSRCESPLLPCLVILISLRCPRRLCWRLRVIGPHGPGARANRSGGRAGAEMRRSAGATSAARMPSSGNLRLGERSRRRPREASRGPARALAALLLHSSLDGDDGGPADLPDIWLLLAL
jgi:hypothetical protein